MLPIGNLPPWPDTPSKLCDDRSAPLSGVAKQFRIMKSRAIR